MAEWWTWPLVVGVLLSSLGAVWAFLNRKGTQRHEARTLHPPTWPEVWARMAAQDVRIETQEARLEEQGEKIATLTTGFVNQTSAIKRLLHSIAKQWPKGASLPVIDEVDEHLLGETLPVEWLRKRSNSAPQDRPSRS